MFAKSVFIFILAIHLGQANEVFEVLDIIIEGATVALLTGNQVGQNATIQGKQLLLDLQANVNDLLSELQTKVYEMTNNITISTVTTTGGSQAKISGCIDLHQQTISAFRNKIEMNIKNACTPNTAEAIRIVDSISMAGNAITESLVNLNSTVVTACPPPHPLDYIGNLLFRDVFKPLCATGAIAGVAANVVVQAVGIPGNVVQLNEMISNVASIISAYPACEAAMLQSIHKQAIPVIIPVVQCTH